MHFFCARVTLANSERLALPSDSISRWPSGKVSTSESKGFQVRNPIPLKIHRLLGLLQVKSCVDGQTFSLCCGAKVWRGSGSSLGSLEPSLVSF
ncbi:hypothetical protein AVEN_183117-1 [Araneus ventricosus]|uniref:Uncharacterized protein n=1 Tax=Araneus ventricosus TaxID=182803 RepID=A0A4Y2M8B9_ARAVE|nr:hypothetical protein AVEN_183117-1 [Araneus ventricosus]